MYTKLRCLRCFNSGFFIIGHKCFDTVVPFCKSGHKYYVLTCLTLTDLQSKSNANTEKLQEIINTRTSQPKESEQKNKQLTENLKGI